MVGWFIDEPQYMQTNKHFIATVSCKNLSTQKEKFMRCKACFFPISLFAYMKPTIAFPVFKPICDIIVRFSLT